MSQSLINSRARTFLLVSFAVAAVASASGEDPEPPDAQARAVAALRNVRLVEIVFAPAKNIIGLGGGTASGVKPIIGRVSPLESAMTDLHAKILGQEIQIELASDVLFDFDKADLRPEAAETLAKVAVVIRSQPGSRVRVVGHTDSKGSHSYNLELSQRRAQSLVKWLKDQDRLTTTPFEVKGLGDTSPVAPNNRPDGSDDPKGRQRNRRVEITIQKP